jgi:hypothetical protein
MTFEELAGRVPGVLAVRTTRDGGDGLLEVHVLAGPRHQADEIARSVRSIALLTDMTLPVERIHVVQLDAEEEPVDAPVPGVDIDLVEEPPPVEERRARVRLGPVEVRVVDGAGHATVELTLGDRTSRGQASFRPTTPTERRAVAEAAIAALTDLVPSEGTIAVDTVALLPMPGIDVVVVTLASVAGEERTLVGAAAVHDGGVHAAIARAALDATNRATARQPSVD